MSIIKILEVLILKTYLLEITDPQWMKAVKLDHISRETHYTASV